MITSRMAQIIIFERSGLYEDSCNTFFETGMWEGQSLYSVEPWLGSMEPIFREMKRDQSPVFIPTVERSIKDQRRYFDYHVYIHPEDDGYLLWLLMDLTDTYERFRKIQQERNELLLQLESLSN